MTWQEYLKSLDGRAATPTLAAEIKEALRAQFPRLEHFDEMTGFCYFAQGEGTMVPCFACGFGNVLFLIAHLPEKEQWEYAQRLWDSKDRYRFLQDMTEGLDCAEKAEIFGRYDFLPGKT